MTASVKSKTRSRPQTRAKSDKETAQEPTRFFWGGKAKKSDQRYSQGVTHFTMTTDAALIE
jgi:hypothetical protein